MSSLAKQLQRLAVPHTQALFGRDTSRSSLLFDPKEAAQLDKETFFALGLNGLEELENIDSEFEQFEETLFSESSQTFERSVQTKEVNQTLDANISDLLIRLSPYFLLKPAHKVLEWLIFRYHIHFYNADELMRCVLPYHETKIFVRVVQLLKLDGAATKWDWLLPLQKSGVHLSRSVLINHCKTNPGFLGFLCDSVKEYTKVHMVDGSDGGKLRVFFSFYTSTIIGVLEADGAAEATISTLIPHLSRGLKSKLADHKASSYMILCQLVSKVKVKVTVLETILNVLAKHMSPDLVQRALSFMVLVFQTQKIEGLPKKCYKYLSRVPELHIVLGKITAQYNTEKLHLAIFTRLIPAAIKHGFQGSGVSSGERRKVSECYIDQCATADAAEVESLNQSLKGALRILESSTTSSPGQCEEAAFEHMIEKLDSVQEGDSQFIEDTILNGLKDTHHDVVRVTLQLGQRLWDLVSDKQKLLASLVNIVDREDKKHSRNNGCQAMAVLCSCDESMMSDVFKAVYPYLLLRNQDGADVAMVTAILQSSMAKKHKILKKTSEVLNVENYQTVGKPFDLNLSATDKGACRVWLAESAEWETNQSVDQLNIIMVQSVIKQVCSMKGDDKENMVELLGSSTKIRCTRQRSSQALTALVLDSLMHKEKSQLLMMSKLAVAQTALLRDLCIARKLSGKVKNISSTPPNLETAVQWVGLCLRKQKPLSVYLRGGWLYNLVNHLLLPDKLIKASFWHLRGEDALCDASLKVFTAVFDLLLDIAAKEPGSDIGAFRSLLMYFLQTHFSDPVTLMKFLGMLWCSHASDQDVAMALNLRLQVRALHIGRVQLAHLSQESLTSLTHSACPVFLPLFVGLSSPVAVVREMCVKCLTVIHNTCDKSSTPYLPVIKKIVRCREEIEADQTFILQALKLAFGKLVDSPETPSKRKRSGSKKAAVKSALSDLVETIINENIPVYVAASLLQSLSLHNNEEMVTGLLPLLIRLLSLPVAEVTADHVTALHLLLARFGPETGHVITADSESLSALLRALKSPLRCEGFVSVQEFTLKQITKKFYDSIVDGDSKLKILSCLLDILVKAESVAIATLVRKILKHVSLEAGHISAELSSVLKSVGAVSFKDVKKLRTKTSSQAAEQPVSVPELENSHWQRITQVLEVVQGKKKINNAQKLVPVFFKLIARIMELEEDGSGEYLKQVLLSCIYNVTARHISKLESDETEELELNVELIVQCIRSSDNPQTHHHALLVLTQGAKLQPEHLLHNVMSIFTFMGANILRQDDSYSFHVMSQILETVIPSLVKACETQKMAEVEEVITLVIRVFVDSYPHIPSHRRLMLFTKLVRIVGEDKYLWRILLMLTNFMITKVTPRSQEMVEAEDSKASNLIGISDMEFYLRLSTSFPPGQQLMAAKDALVYLASLPERKQDKVVTPKRSPKGVTLRTSAGEKYDTEIFSVDVHTAKQLRHFKYAAVSLLVSLFESDSFIGQVAECEEADMLSYYKELLKTIMEYITKLSRSAEENQSNPTSRFWRALLHKVYDLLEKVVSLLQNQTFYDVISALIMHDLPHVQRRAMELLNAKLQTQKEIASDTEVNILLSVVHELSDIVTQTVLRSNVGEENAVNGQTALFGLKLLSRHLASKHPQPFLKVLQLATHVFETRSDNPQVAACGLLCLAEACNSLKVHAIQLLSTFVPKLLQVFQDGEALLSKELLALSAATALHKLVENLTYFISPYLLDILHQVCHMTSLMERSPNLQKPQLTFRLTAIRNILATNVPSRVLIPSLVQCYDKMSASDWQCVIPLMALLAEHFRQINKDQLNSYHSQIVDFFYTCLDFRFLHSQVPSSAVSAVEASVIEAIITMVMKMSEATFRPMIFKLCDWATRHEENKDRVLVFYRLADRLAEKLRSLFTLFAGHIIKHTARMLDENNNSKDGDLFFGSGREAEQKADQLLIYLYSYLYKCFLYDSEGFVSKERFQTLMQPLCDQIENTVGGEDLFEKRVGTHLVPCLAQFAVAAQDDALWRSLNYQILLKTRSPSAEVRFAALLVLDELHKKLGEDYMSLLPETIPFLAELMEDDSDEVEKKCQSVIAEMEKTLGEPLQKYF
ncbi:LOW QUALITY PROTEIN: HEAT repeat-containing protein 1-like [Liolophura sinensis]|uniref:LOW QUALITY PROTEIN: HEAT repeat-containing protein 1-like n=1 Tax=Liolophura sinensis TaxID=3198878 RepID=UPI00315839A8